jgi:acyl-CoA synthetase (AMP-forming)/AMP-acid ligase II
VLRWGDEERALVDVTSGEVWSHRELRDHVDARRGVLPSTRGLTFLFADTSRDCVVEFLACLEADQPVALVDPTLGADGVDRLISTYEPDTLLGAIPVDGVVETDFRAVGERCRYRQMHSDVEPHPDLAVLLSTSGSTGSPKLVRLSRRAIEANAEAIAESLSLRRSDAVPTTLPLHYSYGMSLITSHLGSGGSVVVTDASVLEPRLWQQCRDHRVTFLPGVPFTYHVLKRTGFAPQSVPSLRAMTQAGGHLDLPHREWAHAAMAAAAGEFFVMYGQTEASPRMSCLPSDAFAAHSSSVGRALRDGSFSITGAEGQLLPSGDIGDVVYTGPNVMMGYALNRHDLARGDDMAGRLETGDLGYLDDEGFVYLTGRSTRVAKVFGLRISLDEVEEKVREHGTSAVVAGPPDTLLIVCEWGDEAEHRDVARSLARDLRIPLQSLRFRRIDEVPRLPSGKVDYQQLQKPEDGER